jgi:DNA-binding PadR family transcriptional regulator
MQKVSDLTDGAIEIGPATMYTTIRNLRDANWIKEIDSEGNKKQYIISDEGRRIVQKNFEYRKKLLSLAAKMLTLDGGDANEEI